MTAAGWLPTSIRATILLVSASIRVTRPDPNTATQTLPSRAEIA